MCNVIMCGQMDLILQNICTYTVLRVPGSDGKDPNHILVWSFTPAETVQCQEQGTPLHYVRGCVHTQVVLLS